jgi:hypothetical protein
MLDSTELMGYLQWEGLAIFIGLYRPIATGFGKPTATGFVSLL